MQLLRNAWSLASVGLVLGLFACTDHPTSSEPAIAAGEAPAFFRTAPGPGMVALRSYDRLKQAVTVSKRIGPRGGVIEIEKLDVRIYFPRGALSERTRITVEALEGSVVGFEFQPHGLIFDVPVEIRIDEDSPLLADFDIDTDEESDEKRDKEDEDEDGSAFTLPDLVGVYFLGDPARGVIPLETLPIYIDDGDVVLEIIHFSGYAVASG